MTIEDAIFNQLVKLDVFDYEEADEPHECTCCGNTTVPTYKLKFDENDNKDIHDEQPYLFICCDCYITAKELEDE